MYNKRDNGSMVAITKEIIVVPGCYHKELNNILPCIVCVLFYAYVEIHQVRGLVFNNYQ